MIYDLNNLMSGLGGPEKTRDALDWFRKETKKAGFPGLHLQIVLYGNPFNLSGIDSNIADTEMSGWNYQRLGFSSATHYQFVHFADVAKRTYSDILQDVEKEWKKLDAECELPYFPHISIGWDNNPRFQEIRPEVVLDNPPEEVEKGLRMARTYADAHPEQPPLITVNSWNEWTETSYLEPDDLYGYGYLEAVKRVFLDE